MTPLRPRPAVLLATATLLLAGCSASGSDAPTDASLADFCDAVADGPDGLASDDPETAVDAAGEWAEQLREVGTPEQVTGEARRGFEVFVDFLAGLEADDVERLADDALADGFADGDQAAVDAFVDVSLTCLAGDGPLGELPE